MSTTNLTLHIEGMTCGACVARVEGALKGVPGVTSCAVNLTTNMASVSLDTYSAKAQGLKTPETVHEAVLDAVERAGYRGHLLEGAAADTMRAVAMEGAKHEQVVKRRLVIGALAAIPVVLIDLFHSRLLDIHSPQGLQALTIAQVVLATIVMLTTGVPFFLGAWRAVRHASANMDVLVALGSGVAYVYSIIVIALQWGQHASGDVPMHNELHAAVTIVVLVTLGKFLEARAKKRAASAVAGLATQSAETATRIRLDGKLETIPAHLINVGDRIQVVAHQNLPVDGMVIEGAGSIDQSLLTGESMPIELLVPRNPYPHARPSNIQLPGGALLLDGRIVIEATSTAATSTVAKILELVNTAQASKTKIQGLADRVAGIFVPIVLVLAAINFAAWMWATGDFGKAMMTTIATIVIACPCAMGLATPTAITVAMGRAAKMGILFTQATALETARTIRTVLFDKTGTLTEGRPEVTEVVGNAALHIQSSEVIRLAASLEQYSEHPLAKAVVEYAQMNGVVVSEPQSFRSVPGGGIKARLSSGGQRDLAVGSIQFMETLHVAVDAAQAATLADRGMMVIVLGDIGAGKALGLIGLRDTLRKGVAGTLTELRRRGIRVGVVSGDTETAVRGTLEGLEIDLVIAGVRPEEKAAVVEDAKKSAAGNGQALAGVAFVGDGINDGPALAAADLGIAMAGGTQIAKSAGDVILTNNELRNVPAVLELSHKTLRIIKQNLFWAFAYNVAAIPLAMAGWLSPGFAAGAMVLSSLTVVGNALRLYGGAGSSNKEARSKKDEMAD